MTSKMNRIVSILVLCCLLAGMLSIVAFAENVFAIDALKMKNDTTLTVTVSNASGAAKNAGLAVVYYNEDGQFIKMTISAASISAAETSNIDVAFDSFGADSVKVFLVESTQDMTPISGKLLTQMHVDSGIEGEPNE